MINQSMKLNFRYCWNREAPILRGHYVTGGLLRLFEKSMTWRSGKSKAKRNPVESYKKVLINTEMKMNPCVNNH